MRALRVLPVSLAFVAMPGAQCAQQSTNTRPVEVLDKIVAQEQAEIESLRQYSPIIETYIQIRHPDKQVGVAPGGDKYLKASEAELKRGAQTTARGAIRANCPTLPGRCLILEAVRALIISDALSAAGI